ncbi:MAG TPA: dienelactone hydrolase family protein [Gammaproteobacteria bacterium]|nr:dienelactone hydrolase family protein [Gammaproteobacteria bacterium]
MTRAGVAVASVGVEAGGVTLPGDVAVPRGARGLVVFAHGSGSSRFSRRNRYVAELLNRERLATLLFDLLTAAEHEVDQVTREHRFDIELLTGRLVGTIDWLDRQPELAGLALGLFGASTGAAAALGAAALRPERVRAVVSRGGRPDLAGERLEGVRAPTLLVVGGLDTQVIALNREAAARLGAAHGVEIVPGATHLFEEPGALESVARLAGAWFVKHLED